MQENKNIIVTVKMSHDSYETINGDGFYPHLRSTKG
jgi:hypothetical protein